MKFGTASGEAWETESPAYTLSVERHKTDEGDVFLLRVITSPREQTGLEALQNEEYTFGIPEQTLDSTAWQLMVTP